MHRLPKQVHATTSRALHSGIIDGRGIVFSWKTNRLDKKGEIAEVLAFTLRTPVVQIHDSLRLNIVIPSCSK